MKGKYVLVLSGQEDPMWPFLLDGCTDEEKERIFLYPTDRPDLANLQFNPVRGEVKFRVGANIILGSEIQGIWMRRLISPNFDHFDRDLKDYCITEYNFFYEGLEYVLPDAVWVSRPSAINRAQSKSWQLVIAKELGFNTLDTIFTNSPQTFLEIRKIEEFIYKSIRSPRIPLSKEMHTTVFTTRLNQDHALMAERIISCPGILQSYCPKIADIRVTIFGNLVFSVRIESQAGEKTKIDFRNGGKDLEHIACSLPFEIEEKCRGLVSKLSLLYGAIDLAQMENGEYIFFEINPNGQWGWLEEKCNLPMRRALLNLLFKKGKS